MGTHLPQIHKSDIEWLITDINCINCMLGADYFLLSLLWTIKDLDLRLAVLFLKCDSKAKVHFKFS